MILFNDKHTYCIAHLTPFDLFVNCMFFFAGIYCLPQNVQNAKQKI